MSLRCCVICGKSFYAQSHAKTCGDKCRQTLARRKKDAEGQAVDIGVKLEKLLQGYEAGAIDHELAKNIVYHIGKRFDKLREAVDAEQLNRLMEK